MNINDIEDFKDKLIMFMSYNLIAMYLLIMVLIYIGGLPENTRFFFGLPIAYFGYKKTMLHDERYLVLLFLSIVFVSGALSSLYNGNNSIGSFLSLYVHFGISLYIYFDRENSKYIQKIFSYLLSLIFLAYLRMPNSVLFLKHVSRNYISILTMFFLAILGIYLSKEKRKMNIFYPLMVLISSVWGFGRGGIISSLFLVISFVILNIIMKFKKKSAQKFKFNYRISLYFLILIVILVLSVTLFPKVFKPFIMRGLKTPRFEYYLEYARSLKFFPNLIFGSNFSNMIVGELFHGNFHNSFIQMHALYGLPLSVTIIYFICKIINQLWSTRNCELLIIFIAILMRAFTDRVFFSGYNEIILFYFIVWIIFKKGDE